MKLTLKVKPEAGDTFTIDGKKYTVLQSEKYLELEFEATSVSETLTDVQSTFSEK